MNRINQHVAGRLEEAARLLQGQAADRFRVGAYLRAAHETGKTRDWVVLYGDNGAGEHRHTAITAGYGPLRGRRVIAGREDECRAVYLLDPKPSRPRHTTGSRKDAAHGLLFTRNDTARSLGG